jgi:hypothetical protein
VLGLSLPCFRIDLMNCSSFLISTLERWSSDARSCILLCLVYMQLSLICTFYVGCRCPLFKLRTVHTVFNVTELANSSTLHWASVRTNQTRLPVLRQGRLTIPQTAYIIRNLNPLRRKIGRWINVSRHCHLLCPAVTLPLL